MTIGLLDNRTGAERTAIPSEPTRALRPTGEAVAALLGAAIGMLTLAFVNLATGASDAFNAWVHGIGKLWMPGAQGIGPYSGKETLSVIAWLVSWAILHPALKARELALARWLVVFLVMVAVATTFIWPPVFEYFAH
jgi:hypothetical protein